MTGKRSTLPLNISLSCNLDSSPLNASHLSINCLVYGPFMAPRDIEKRNCATRNRESCDELHDIVVFFVSVAVGILIHFKISDVVYKFVAESNWFCERVCTCSS